MVFSHSDSIFNAEKIIYNTFYHSRFQIVPDITLMIHEMKNFL